MKVVVNAELIKSLNKKKDAAQLNYFKKELIKVLEKNDEEIVSKAIEDYDNSIKKTYSEIGIEKAGYGIGTVRVWKGQKFRKIAPGKWRRIYDSNTRGARQSINIIKKKIANAQSIDELLQLVMENTNRFMDADGKLLPIVEELQNAVKESKGRLNTGKPSTQEQIEQFKKENNKDEKNVKDIKKLPKQTIKRLQNLKIPTNSVIHLDLYDTDETDLMMEFLFSILITKLYGRNEDIFYLSKEVEIKIEIPNGFINFTEKFPILTLFPSQKLSIKELKPLIVPNDITSNVQVVANYLKALKENQIEGTDLYFDTISDKDILKYETTVKAKNFKPRRMPKINF